METAAQAFRLIFRRSLAYPSAAERSKGLSTALPKLSSSLYEAIGQAARQAKVNFIDETPWYQKRILMWLWVMVNPSVACFKVLTSRSKEAFQTLVDKWAGVLVSDGYGVYRNWINAQQTCLAHLIRRAKGLSERDARDLAWFGQRVLSELQRLIAWALLRPPRARPACGMPAWCI
jgi:transposase